MGRAAADRGRVAFTGSLVVVLLAWNNVVVTRVPDFPGSYVVVNTGAAALLLAAARASGLSWAELGLSRRSVRAGLRWGGGAAALVVLGCAIALAIPPLRELLADDRVAGLGWADIAGRVLFRIPFGTVLWEEVAFRGVLFASLARLLPVRRAAVAGAVVFGLWHIRPTLSGLDANDLVEGPVARAAAVLLACAGTAVAGLVFTWLRVRSGSLLAPALLHLATNSVGTLAAAAAHRLG